MTSLMPQFLQSLQQSLQASLTELDAGSVKFCHAWSVLMLALASSDQANQQQAARYAYAQACPSEVCVLGSAQDMVQLRNGTMWKSWQSVPA
jgi:hypothetical protein